MFKAKNLSGVYGEKCAKDYLIKNGYKIICTNYKTKLAEIDIIAKEKNVLCFIEVKTRKNKNFGNASDFVNYYKRQKIILGARTYLMSNKHNGEMRFDVVEVYGDFFGEDFLVSEINIIKNAFDAT